jgi:hypothetical protein
MQTIVHFFFFLLFCFNFFAPPREQRTSNIFAKIIWQADPDPFGFGMQNQTHEAQPNCKFQNKMAELAQIHSSLPGYNDVLLLLLAFFKGLLINVVGLFVVSTSYLARVWCWINPLLEA